MKISAIICEYNPFHNGHKYQIATTRFITNCDAVVGLMSGNFVQRGDVAIFDKHTRATAAILSGIDLLLELPAVLTLHSAEIYARNAITTLNALTCVDFLSFGAECDDISSLSKIAKTLAFESFEFTQRLKKHLDSGLSFANARAIAVSEVLNDDICEILKTPNNILAIEYLKALYRTKSAITPIAIKRVGAGHDDLKSTNSFASATYIRNLISSNTAISSEFMPHDCTETFNKEATFSIKNIETSIILNICKMSLSELENISDVTEGLENRIKKLAMESKFNNIDDLASAIKSKRYAFSRIRRILLASLLNISKDDQQTLPKYIKILDFNQTGRDILNQIKKTTSLPLAKNMNGIKSDKDAVLMWERELLFDRIYSLCKDDILLN